MSVIGYLRDGRIVDVTNESPLPVIARDSWLVIANNDTPFVPTLASSSSQNQTDVFGNTNSTQANIGIYSPVAEPNVVIPDPWRIRRFIVLYYRTASGTTSVEIAVQVYGRLIRSDGTTTNWRGLGSSVADVSFANDAPARLVIPSSLSGVQGYDQYRIVFRRNPDSTPAPELSNIRVYVEM